MLRIDQSGKGLLIALLAHMPIGRPGKLPPSRLVTGLGHAREPEINAVGQYRSKECLPIFGRRLGSQMQESIAHLCPLIDLGEQAYVIFGLSEIHNPSPSALLKIRGQFLSRRQCIDGRGIERFMAEECRQFH